MSDTTNAESVSVTRYRNALSLLVHAARTSPPLRDAVATVDAEIRRLRAAIREHRDKRYVLAPNPQHHIDRELWEVLGDE